MEIIGNCVLLKALNFEVIKFRVGEEHTIGLDALLHMVDVQRPFFVQLLGHTKAETAIGRIVEIIFNQSPIIGFQKCNLGKGILKGLPLGRHGTVARACAGARIGSVIASFTRCQNTAAALETGT